MSDSETPEKTDSSEAPDTSGAAVSSSSKAEPKTSPKTSSSSKPKAKTKRTTKKSTATKKTQPERVCIQNTMMQVVSVEIRDVKGELVSLEIPARQSKFWPKLEDYGADFRIKLSRGILKVSPVK